MKKSEVEILREIKAEQSKRIKELEEALKNILLLTDNQIPSHKGIWMILYEALKQQER